MVRTPLGHRTVEAVNAAMAALEQQWAVRVGVERYAQFSSVLKELALA